MEVLEHFEEPQFEGFELHGGSVFDVQSTWVQDVDLLWLNITLSSFFFFFSAGNMKEHGSQILIWAAHCLPKLCENPKRYV